MTRLPHSQHGLVFAGLKATPSGWPAASLDPGSGRRQHAVSGSGPERRIHKSQVSTVSGDCRPAAELADRHREACAG
jgi:hypothetical protein